MIKQYIEETLEDDPQKYTARGAMVLMMQHNYVCHHLFDTNQLTKIDIGFRALTQTLKVSSLNKIVQPCHYSQIQYAFDDEN